MYKICSASPKQWDEFVVGTKQKSIFAISDYQTVSPITNSYYLVKIDNENLLGYLFPDDSVLTNYSLYQGIFYKYENFQEMGKNYDLGEITAQVITKHLQKKKSLNISLHHSIKDVRFIYKLGKFLEKKKINVKIEVKYTGIIDLTNLDSFEDYFSNIRNVRRQEYNKFKKLEFILDLNGSADVMFKLLDLTFSRQQISLSLNEKKSRDYLIRGILEKKLAKILVVRNQENNQPMSALIFSSFENNAYYMFGGTDPQYRRSGVSTFLILEFIKLLWKKKINKIDVCGINSPNRGDYKTSLNAEPLPYYDIIINR